MPINKKYFFTVHGLKLQKAYFNILHFLLSLLFLSSISLPTPPHSPKKSYIFGGCNDNNKLFNKLIVPEETLREKTAKWDQTTRVKRDKRIKTYSAMEAAAVSLILLKR